MPKQSDSTATERRGRSYPATLPQTGFLRLPQIIGDPNATPPVPALVPVGKSTWWAGVASGRYPAACRLGPRTTAWRVEDILALIESVAGAST